MTVLTKMSYPDSVHSHQGSLFTAHRRYDGSRPVQGRIRRFPVALTGKNYRKALGLAILLSLSLCVVVLFFDLGSLCVNGTSISQLSARIEALNSNKAQLQDDLALAMNHPVLRTVGTEEGEETVIMLTAVLPDLTESGMN